MADLLDLPAIDHKMFNYSLQSLADLLLVYQEYVYDLFLLFYVLVLIHGMAIHSLRSQTYYESHTFLEILRVTFL